MKLSVKDRIAARRRAGLCCAVKGCHLPVQRLGSLCETHDLANERTGDPEGRTILRGDLRPYLSEAATYIKAHEDHPAIRAALLWLEAYIYRDRPVATSVRRNATPRQRLDRWLARMKKQGVYPREALEMLVAVFLMQEREPRRFASDRHFRHQLAIRFLRQVRAPRMELSCGGKPLYRYDRVTVRTRELLWADLENSVGLLCFRVARVISRTMIEHTPASFVALATPLPNETPGNRPPPTTSS